MKLYRFGDSSSERVVNRFLLQIAAEAALLPVAFFPRLKELTFHNNPLTITRSGTVGTWLPGVLLPSCPSFCPLSATGAPLSLSLGVWTPLPCWPGPPKRCFGCEKATP